MKIISITIKQIEFGTSINQWLSSKGWYCVIYFNDNEEMQFTTDSLKKITLKIHRIKRAID